MLSFFIKESRETFTQNSTRENVKTWSPSDLLIRALSRSRFHVFKVKFMFRSGVKFMFRSGDSGIEVWCGGGARSGCVVGWGWVNKEDNGLGLGDRWSHWMDSTAGRLAGFLEGDSFYLLAGGGNSKAG